MISVKIYAMTRWVSCFLIILFFSPLFAEQEAIHFTLEEAIGRAVECNRTIMNSQAQVETTSLSAQSAYKEFLPKLTPIFDTGYGGGELEGTGYKYGGGVSFSQKFYDGLSVNIAPRVYATRDKWCTDINARLTQPILRGWGPTMNGAKLEASRYQHRSSVRSYYITQVGVILKTIQAFYDVVKGEALLKTLDAAEKRLQQIYCANIAKEKIGLAEASDVLKAEIELKNAQEEFVRANERLQEAENQLKMLIVVPFDTEIVVEAPLEIHRSDIDPEEAVQLALSRRLEIFQALDRYKESLRLCRVAKQGLLPDLNFVLNYVNSECDESFRTSMIKCCKGTAWGIGLTSNGYGDYAQNEIASKQSELAVSSASREVDLVRDTVVSEVKREILALEKALKSIDIAEEQIAAAKMSFKLAELKFNHGMIDSLDLLRPEGTIRKKEVEMLTSMIDYIIAEYRLLAAMGLMVDDEALF